MRILGISSQYHDAAVTVINNGKIEFAAHAERYSKVKNDPFLNQELISAATSYGKPDLIALHEKPWAKRLRHAVSGNWRGVVDLSTAQWIDKFYPALKGIPTETYWHHQTHAAAGVFTSGWDDCAVMVVDAIGEFDTATIWHWCHGVLKKKHSVRYPSSLGLFYSAVTHRVGLKPMEDEYILMGMAAYGNELKALDLQRDMELKYTELKPMMFNTNFQRGMPAKDFVDVNKYTLARAAQNIVEENVLKFARLAKELTNSNKLVFMGGVALNCVANSNLYKVFDHLHIMPNPGDAGSSLGAASIAHYSQTAERVEWEGPYLGTEIPGMYPVQKALRSLERGEIFGIANGRAEFGPRALGNRSLLADPKGGDIKDRMNSIKRRQKFRPFAPVILAERVHEYFDMPGGQMSPYMQVTAKCLRPQYYPAIVHYDGSSRVQTVTREQHPGLHKLLREYYTKTGCPMLVNTSLNIKGQPIVDDEADAAAFAKYYEVDVHTRDD